MNLERELTGLIGDALSDDPRLALATVNGGGSDGEYVRHLRHQRLAADLRAWEAAGVDIVPS